MKKTNVPAPVTVGKLKSTDGIYGIRFAFKYKANMIAGERFPNPDAPLLPEEGWTRFADGVVGGSFEKFRDSEKFRKAVAEMKNLSLGNK